MSAGRVPVIHTPSVGGWARMWSTTFFDQERQEGLSEPSHFGMFALTAQPIFRIGMNFTP